VIKPLGDLLEELVTSTDVAPRLRTEAAEAQEAGLELFFPQAAARNDRVRGLVTSAGVVELQLSWPCKQTDSVRGARIFSPGGVLP